jgi:type I restriction enzyme S subunit
MIDLMPEQLGLVRDILDRHMPGRQVMVFGSRAVTGRAKPHSDLDLCLMGDAPVPLANMARLNEAFSDSALPFKVDVVIWAELTDEFRTAITPFLVPVPAE